MNGVYVAAHGAPCASFVGISRADWVMWAIMASVLLAALSGSAVADAAALAAMLVPMLRSRATT